MVQLTSPDALVVPVQLCAVLPVPSVITTALPAGAGSGVIGRQVPVSVNGMPLTAIGGPGVADGGLLVGHHEMCSSRSLASSWGWPRVAGEASR